MCLLLFKKQLAEDDTAKLDPQYTQMKNDFANKPKGLRRFRDHCWKALGKENSDLLGLFLCDPFSPPFSK